MKKELIISIGITIILLIGVFALRNQSTTAIPVKNQTNTQSTFQTISKAEVALHKSASDCWIIIDNAVYDVTSYLSNHPGGSKTIIPSCGIDATAAYNAIKNGRGHSAAADADLSTLLVGTVQ